MGWGYGINSWGREVGYTVEATCDQEGCEEEIDRGLGHVCGPMHDGDEHSCGDYFCGDHLFYGVGLPNAMCGACSKTYDEEHPELVAAKIAEIKERWA